MLSGPQIWLQVHSPPEDANRFGVNHENAKGKDLLRYVSVRKEQMVCRAAAKLWAKGLQIKEALKIARNAMQ